MFEIRNSRVLGADIALLCLPLLLASACGGDASKQKEPADAGTAVTTEHCSYEPVPATAGAGGTVVKAPLLAGAAEAVLDVPVSTALGAYTARAGFLGTSGKVDLRKVAISGSFNPSIGVESAPKIKVLALQAGSEHALIVKADLGLMYAGLTFDVEKRLGSDYQGKVIISASHSHSAWGQNAGSFIFEVGLGRFRQLVYERYLDTIERVAREAIAAQRSAKIGIVADFNFDPNDELTGDRRPENDAIMGGPKKDSSMFMIRVDGTDDVPIAALPVYGVHGTIMGADNSFASTDAPGGTERWLEEQFDSKVVVMHLQGAAGDVSPRRRGSMDCTIKPGKDSDPCFSWLSIDGHGRVAAPMLLGAWRAAGANMKSEIALEMMTQSIETGPNAETFTVRGGSLRYAPFDLNREADRKIYDDSGAILSPIDEFNAPVGAALCEADVASPESAYPLFPEGLMPGTDLLPPYGACVRIDTAADILGRLLRLDREGTDSTHPVCQSTRATVSALRIGEFVLGTIPGELTVMLADQIRDHSPVAKEKTILLGYAQGHTGYTLTVEDWLQGGFEPSINTWGPLEGEYMSERLLQLMALAITPEREEVGASGATRVATLSVTDDLPLDDPAPMAGTVPTSVPDRVWLRTGPASQAQPASVISRVSGHATFVWIGDDPKTKTPQVSLEREVSTGVFEEVRRRSGRLVRSADVLLMYTPQPLRRIAGEAQTHYWAAEWQAVPWAGSDLGSTTPGSLDKVAGLPLGRYRFHVVGKSFDIHSDPWTVTPLVLQVAGAHSGTRIEATVSMLDAKTFRLLDLTAPSNHPIPVRSGSFAVELEVAGGSPLEFSNVGISSEGVLSVDAAGQAQAIVSITVSDSFGNSGSATLL